MSQQGQSQRPGGGGGGTVTTLKGNSGGFVGPDGGGNINVVGDGTTITIAGNPGTNTLTASVLGEVAIDFQADDLNFAIPAANVLIVHGGPNINTSVPVPNASTINVNLNTSISQPATNGSGTQGLYSLGGSRFMHAFGTQNTFLGSDAGNLTNTSSDNVGIGQLALFNTTTASNNVAVGKSALLGVTAGGSNVSIGSLSSIALTTGSTNTAIGSASLSQLVNGTDNIAIGFAAAENYTTNESSNIIIGNLGVVGESNVIRIGIQGGAPGEQNLNYQAGITGVTTTTVSANKLVNVGTDGQLGETTLTSTDSSVTITSLVSGGVNTINLAVTGGSALFTLTTVNATPTALITHALTANSAVTMNATIVAAKSDFSESLFGTAVVGARRVAGGAILVDIPNISFGDDAAGLPALTADVSGNNVRLLVTGEAATTWNWKATASFLTQP